MTPNTRTTNRLDFTAFFLRFAYAADAHPAYVHLFTTHQHLFALLSTHPAMVPNLQQIFSTPANSKNKVYFMWDFLLRTFQHIAAQIDPREPETSAMWEEVLGRAIQAKELMVDETGMLERMNARVGYKDDGGVEFRDEEKALARTLDEFPEGCKGCGKEEREDGKALLVCARCKEEKYCSTECQKRRWKAHKKECGKQTA
jgi:hypothetical protein